MKLLLIDWENAFVVVGFGFGMVLVILICLVLLLVLWDKITIFAAEIHKRADESKKERKAKRREERARKLREQIVLGADDNEIAAIGLALHLYASDIHDKESNIITIKRIERRYSPWNSKIHGMNNINN